MNKAAQSRFTRRVLAGSCLAVVLYLAAGLPVLTVQAAQAQQTQTAIQKQEIPNAPPRGKKLYLTDGSFHLVRSYERKGDRVRYYSIERSAWEEIPASMVDWAATRKDEAEAAALDSKIEEKKKEAEVTRIAEEVDADASLEVAPGLFLPDPPGLFVLEGKTFRSLPMVGADVKRDKGRLVTQIFVPVPIPSRHKVELAGEHASFRVNTAQPEFFIRTTDGHEPEMELIQARVKGGVREVESISPIITGQKSENRKIVSIERWKLANGVFRLTLSQSLAPGEYVFAEILQEGMDLGMWEFGVDGPSSAKPPAKK